MRGILLHARTATQIEDYIARPTHALLLTGSKGAGKGTLARHIASELLSVTPDKLEIYPYVSIVEPTDKKSISIDEVRALKRFVALKIPARQAGIVRVIIVEQAQLLTHEGQNAFLKLLEEPPEATAIILTATNPRALLPTIVSRTQIVPVYPVAEQEVKKYFSDKGYETTAIQQAWLVSGGLMGLMSAYLADEADHPLVVATQIARELLQKTTYERLQSIDELSRQPDSLADVLFVLQQMAHLSLARDSGNVAAQRWQQVLAGAYEAETSIAKGAQAKLALLNLMLTL